MARKLADFMPAPLARLAPGAWFGGPPGENPDMVAFFDGQDAGGGAPFTPWRAGRRHDIWSTPDPAHNVLFAGYDNAGRDRFFSLGYKRALAGHLDEPGFRFMASLGVKIMTLDPAFASRQTRLHAIRTVFGREWHLGATSVTLLAGGSFVLNPDDAIQRTRKTGRLGPVVMADLWHNWGEGWLGSRYSSLFAMADQASRSSYIRLRHGFAVGDFAWRIGPEASLGTGAWQSRRGVRLQDGWRRMRLGLHAGEIAVRSVRFGVSAGGEWRENRKTAFYSQLTAYIRY